MTPVLKKMMTLLFAASVVIASQTVSADSGGYMPDESNSCKNVEPYDGIRTIDEEFGAGAQAITHCLTVRNHAKVVISVETVYPITPDGVPNKNKATFLSNIEKMVRNYEIHGMTIGKDVDVVVVFSQVGALLATTAHPLLGGTNKFAPFVQYGLDHGFKFYLCQEASRALGINMSNKIPGVNFVPGGMIAVADFEMLGYALLVP